MGGPLGVGLFCNLSPCLFYFIFFSPFFESSAAFYFIFGYIEGRESVVASERKDKWSGSMSMESCAWAGFRGKVPESLDSSLLIYLLV